MAQSKVNTHGFKMVGLRKVAGLVSGVPRWSSYRVCIAWSPVDGKIFYEEFVGDNNWVVWSNDYIGCGVVYPGQSQQDIADQVAEAILLYREHVKGERS